MGGDRGSRGRGRGGGRGQKRNFEGGGRGQQGGNKRGRYMPVSFAHLLLAWRGHPVPCSNQSSVTPSSSIKSSLSWDAQLIHSITPGD
eukprot:1160987-Pelagomonas_calceolata.AAC.8